MRRLRGFGLIVALACLSVVTAACGSWQVTSKPTPVEAIHVALLHTGKVLLVAGSGADKAKFDAGTFRTSIWDPTTNTFQSVDTPWDAFCAGHAFLADGRLLVAGGTSGLSRRRATATTRGPRRPTSSIRIRAGTWRRPTAAVARWYPTVVELGDGDCFTLGGFNENAVADDGDRDLRRDELVAHRSTLRARSRRSPRTRRCTCSATAGCSTRARTSSARRRWRPESGTSRTTATRRRGRADPEGHPRDEAMSVLLPPAQDQRVLIIGGGRTNGKALPTETTALVEPEGREPGVRRRPAARHPEDLRERGHPAELHGARDRRRVHSVKVGNNPVYSAEIFDPKTDTWSKAATPTVPRVYHSAAILLPDGRVATFGGNPVGSFETASRSTHRRTWRRAPAAVRSPVARPSPPTAGATRSPRPRRPRSRRAVLIRPAAVTHSSDSNQRLVSLGMTTTTNGVSVSVPTNPNLTPPGWYMLFVDDANGVPSVARWVHVT